MICGADPRPGLRRDASTLAVRSSGVTPYGDRPTADRCGLDGHSCLGAQGPNRRCGAHRGDRALARAVSATAWGLATMQPDTVPDAGDN
jgi:hypothetical protein